MTAIEMKVMNVPCQICKGVPHKNRDCDKCEGTGFTTMSCNLFWAAPDMLETLKDCDKAFVSWQVGQIPGRPEDILALIVKVRAAIARAQPSTAGGDHE